MRVHELSAEALLSSGVRSQLSTASLLRLYLDPFPLFKDVCKGDLFLREASLRYNRALAPVLLIYLARWAVLLALFAGTCFGCQAGITEGPVFAVLMSFAGVGVACSTATLCLLGTGYLLLKRSAAHAPDRR